MDATMDDFFDDLFDNSLVAKDQDVSAPQIPPPKAPPTAVNSEEKKEKKDKKEKKGDKEKKEKKEKTGDKEKKEKSGDKEKKERKDVSPPKETPTAVSSAEKKEKKDVSAPKEAPTAVNGGEKKEKKEKKDEKKDGKEKKEKKDGKEKDEKKEKKDGKEKDEKKEKKDGKEKKEKKEKNEDKADKAKEPTKPAVAIPKMAASPKMVAKEPTKPVVAIPKIASPKLGAKAAVPKEVEKPAVPKAPEAQQATTEKKDKKDKKEKKKEKKKLKEDKLKKLNEAKRSVADAMVASPEAKRAKTDQASPAVVDETADFWAELDDDDPEAVAAKAAEEAAVAARAKAEAEKAEAIATAAALDADPLARKVIKLTDEEETFLLGDGRRWLRRVQHVSTGATIEVHEATDSSRSSEAWIQGLDQPDLAKMLAIKRGVLCINGLLASLRDGFVQVLELPVADGQMEVLDIPEASDRLQPRKLIETLDVVAFFAQEKDKEEPKPPPGPIPDFAKALGFQHGQAVEGRYEEDWFHGEITGFSSLHGDGIILEWLGGGEAELSPIDVRPAKTKAPPKAPQRKPGGQLVVIGADRARMAAMLRAMATVERSCPGHFSERHRPKETKSLFGFGLKLHHLPDSDGGAVARSCSKIAAASEAIVESFGRSVAIAGEADERRRAEVLALQLVSLAGPYHDAGAVPEELAFCCSHLRVPAQAQSRVSGDARSTLSTIEDETATITFWLPVGTTVTPRVSEGIFDLGSASVDIGSTVYARYAEDWYAATLLGEGIVPGKIRISWDFDGSKDEVPVANVRPGSKTQRQRQLWLKAPRVLAIIGGEKQRRACALRVMAVTNSNCPDLWTATVGESLAEARDGLPDTEVIFGVEAHSHAGTEIELEWAGWQQGQQTMRRAAAAAQCAMELIQNHFFIAGFPNEREKGREYWRWAMTARREGGIRASSLSVPDADMREDIAVILVPEGRAAKLRPDRLAKIERETQTLSLFDDGGGSAVTDGHRRLLICGSDDSRREMAKEWIEALLDAPAFDAPAAETGSGRSSSSTSLSRPLEKRDSFEEREPKMAKVDMTNPKEVLATMPWPASINQWGQLQRKIWAGHPPLAKGWIRVWSRSKDSEYYLRLKDMKTTLDIGDVSEF